MAAQTEITMGLSPAPAAAGALPSAVIIAIVIVSGVP